MIFLSNVLKSSGLTLVVRGGFWQPNVNVINLYPLSCKHFESPRRSTHTHHNKAVKCVVFFLPRIAAERLINEKKNWLLEHYGTLL